MDVHLATELILLSTCARPPAQIGLVSSDWDMLPALLAAAQLAIPRGVGVTTVRFSSTETYQDRALKKFGVQIIKSQFGTRAMPAGAAAVQEA